MIIIVSKNKYDILETLQIHDKVEIIDDCHLLYLNQLINFDYLISDDSNLLINLKKAGVLFDEDIPVTNFFGQTSIENIYVGNVDTALDHLYNGE